MMLILFLIVSAFFFYYVFVPLFSKELRGVAWSFGSGEVEDLKLKKQQIVTALNDLEYDLQLNKIAKQDYEEIKDQLMREGTAVLKALNISGTPPRKHSKKTAA